MVDIAGYSDSGARILVAPPELATLETDRNVADLLAHLAFGDDRRVCTSAAAKHGPFVLCRSHTEDLSSKRHHVERQAVARESRLCRKHTGINSTTHGSEQTARDALQEALDDLTSPHALWSNYIAQLLGFQVLEQCNVRAAVGIVLDTLNHLLARLLTLEIDNSYPPLVPAAAMSYSDLTSHVPASFSLTDLRIREHLEWSALPEMLVDGSLQVPQAWRPRLVGLHLDGASRPCRGGALELSLGGGHARLDGVLSGAGGGRRNGVGAHRGHERGREACRPQGRPRVQH